MGENKEYHSVLFFKVLLDSSAPRISIPPNFIRKIGEKLLPNCELQTNGKSYSVKIEKIGKLFYFTEGWLKFVEGNGLEDGYFLVFQLNQQTSNFDVVVYDYSQTDAVPTWANCAQVKEEPPQTSVKPAKVKEESPECSDEQRLPRSVPTADKRARVKEEPPECSDEQRLPRARPTSNKRPRVKKKSLRRNSSEDTKQGSANSSEPTIKIENEDSDHDLIKGHEGSSDCSNLSFSATFKERDWVVIPKEFVVKTGMANQRRVTLKDSSGKRWPVNLRPVKDGELKMTNGWDDFRRAFRVDPNVICIFEFTKSNVDVLNVTLKRSRGRPCKIR